MYAGHFAAALAIKAAVPRAPTSALLVGSAVLDLVFGALTVAGIERATLTPGVSPGFRLDYVDWSHSLATSLLWSVAFAALFAGRGPAVAAACGLAVFSHFPLDVVMHRPDMALWPGSEAHLGLRLWERVPAWWFVELAFVLACAGFYAVRARRDGTFGGRAPAACAALVGLHFLQAPFLSPLY